MKITIDDVMSWGPCFYDRDDILEITGGRESMTIMEIIEDENIELHDRVWVLRKSEVLGEKLKEYLYDIVTPSIKKHCLSCGIPDVEEWAKKRLPGENRSEEQTSALVKAKAVNAISSVLNAAMIVTEALDIITDIITQDLEE